MSEGIPYKLSINACHLYDCLRANKSTSAWGVEAHVPVLDKKFIKTAIRPYLARIEKQKEQFSDGVTDVMLMHASFAYPENTPTTKEGYHYRSIFENVVNICG
ncbi:putative asparagine synthase (glutamine-hydrolyzing) [Rosa chinensis]|uniref:Putative asparagine synthase (Glutamine-hydrolyzing) n=1 Tax=Rosa chinensis TaxID=74649 RepID=A0A2P6RT67_ROSCH|nr:putative asparagine synthase (glutamine-hydrolyzing) [Rosa chinensis]